MKMMILIPHPFYQSFFPPYLFLPLLLFIPIIPSINPPYLYLTAMILIYLPIQTLHINNDFYGYSKYWQVTLDFNSD